MPNEQSEMALILREVARKCDMAFPTDKAFIDSRHLSPRVAELVERVLRESGLLRLLEAGQAIREERIGQVSDNSYWIEEWEAAKAAICQKNKAK